MPLSELNSKIKYKAIQDVGKKIVIGYDANSQTECISTISTVPCTYLPNESFSEDQNDAQKMNNNKQRVLHA
jgi:hypothetical protein